MLRVRTQVCLLLVVLFGASSSLVLAQQPSAAAASPVPRFVKFSGSAGGGSGKWMGRTIGVTFAIYKDQQGGAPVWVETQSVKLDASGHYDAQLGATNPDGLPTDLFASGEARWIGVQVEGQDEQARVLLLSVPYALKAGDAQTVGGLPPSAFVLAAPPVVIDPSSPEAVTSATSAGASPAAAITGTGTVNFVPLFTGASVIGNSVLFQSGTGATAKVGINTNVPASTLDVKGAGTIRGALTLPATAQATAAAGKASQTVNWIGSSFNSSTSTAVNQTFRLQAEPAGNNTSAASGTLNLLYASGANAAAETGLKIASNGQITFAPGQTFPVTGTGTVTSVGLSAPTTDFTVTGSPVTTSGTLGLTWKVAPTNSSTANAIVKRDGSGGFSAVNIGSTGTITANTSKPNAINGITSFDGGFAVHGSAQTINGTQMTAGVLGDSISTGRLSSGVLGQDANGVGSVVTEGIYGSSGNPVGIGILGSNGVNGLSQAFNTHSGFQRVGIWGDAEVGGGGVGIGVVATSDTGAGLLAENGPGAVIAALVGQGGAGVSGGTGSGAVGIEGVGGDQGCCDSQRHGGAAAEGILGIGGSSVAIVNSPGDEPGAGGVFQGGNSQSCGGMCGGDGIIAGPGVGVGTPSGNAGTFLGNVTVTGTIFAGSKSFKIDHPIDPANKYLVHASMESNEMVNVYTGNVALDGSGSAVVELPDWFEAENGDFRYQLTAVGRPGPGLYVAEEISGHRFSISGGTPGGKVSWQVTGVRQDAYAKAHPMVVEEAKTVRERGFYLHPELFGAPAEKQTEWSRHPAMMRKMKEGKSKLVGAGAVKAAK